MKSLRSRIGRYTTYPEHKRKTVTRFTPPPVDPVEVPINIRISMTSNPAGDQDSKGYTIYPTDLADWLLKNATSQEIGFVSLRSTAPPIRRNTAIKMETRECMLSLRQRNRFTQHSRITINPKPPTKQVLS